MKVKGEFCFSVAQQLVWDALQDPDIVASVIPSIGKIETIGENAFYSKLDVKIGPLRGEFTNQASLTDKEEPNSFKMLVTSNGPIGEIKSVVTITLSPTPTGTNLFYVGEALLKRKMTKVGQRIVERTVAKIVNKALTRLDTKLAAT